MNALDQSALDQIFLQAHTHNGWLPTPVTDETIRRLYEVMRMAPTSANSNPGRFVFVKSPDAKERLKPTLSPGNVDKTMSAPATVIVAYDPRFHDQMPKLFPARDMKSMFEAMPEEGRIRAARLNATLQGGYLILAARSLGLDCGPMAGFDNEKVDQAFLAESGWKSLFLVNIGHGDVSKVYPRNPRLSFEDSARIA